MKGNCRRRRRRLSRPPSLRSLFFGGEGRGGLRQVSTKRGGLLDSTTRYFLPARRQRLAKGILYAFFSFFYIPGNVVSKRGMGRARSDGHSSRQRRRLPSSFGVLL